MIDLKRLSQKLRRIKVMVICDCLLSMFFCSYAQDANESLASSKCLKYHNVSHIGFAESTLYQELYYEIELPQGVIWCESSAIDSGVCFLYPDSQVICAFTMDVWVNADTDRSDRTDMVFNYNGYTFSPWAFLHLDYFFDYYRDVPETQDPQAHNNNWYWDDDNGFDDANELYSAYIQGRFEKCDIDGDGNRLKAIHGRRHRYFNRDGVRVVLYNILPENFEYFYNVTYNSLYVPDKNEFQRMSDDLNEIPIFTICDCKE